MNFGQAGEQQDINMVEEAEFRRPWKGSQTFEYSRSSLEPALRETVDAQIESTHQHVEDLVKLVKAELGGQLGGQIELLRRDINDLQSKYQQKRQHSWDLRKLIIAGVIAMITTSLGVLITWLLMRPET